MPTNTRESGLETLIVNWLVEQNGYEQGASVDYNRDYAVDEVRLFRFLEDTQPDQLAKLGVRDSDLKRVQFLDRLRGEIAKRGVVDVLRKGLKFTPQTLSCSTKHHQKRTRQQKNSSIKTFSASRGSCNIQTTIQSWLSTLPYLSTVCL